MPHWTLWLAVGLFLWRLTSFAAARRIGGLIRIYLDETARAGEPREIPQASGAVISPPVPEAGV